MVKNYIRIVFRTFLRNRNYTIINTLGLSLGISMCMIIFLIISYEVRFDRFHTKSDRIYRIVMEDKQPEGTEYSGVTPYPLTKAFRNDFAEVPLVTQLHYEGDAYAKVGAEKLNVEQVLFADSLFFDVFDFKVLSGNPRVELGEPGKAFLTESLAARMFAGRQPTTIRINNELDLDVAGIIADPPPNSHISFSMVISMPSLSSAFVADMPIDEWGLSASGYVYIVLPDQVAKGQLEERFRPFISKYMSAEDAARKSLHLQPLSSIHFDEQFTNNPGEAENAVRSNLIVLGAIGVFILAIACVNFVNLSTAMAVRKSKEIGIRKTLGAGRGQLTRYFLGETFVLTLFSILLSLCVCEWMLPWVNNFLNKSLELDLINDIQFTGFLIGLLLITSLLAGLYPSLFLARLNPIAILKNKTAVSQNSGSSLRKVLVAFQFFIAQGLVVGTLIISDQMEFIRSKPLGFEKDAIVNLPIQNPDKATFEKLRSRLEAHSSIASVTFALGAPTSDNNVTTSYSLAEEGTLSRKFFMNLKPVDRFYIDLYNIQLLAGRTFTESDEKASDFGLPSDQQRFTFIVNESTASQLGFEKAEDIVGKKIKVGVNDVTGEIIGVVKDFHVSSLRNELGPVVMMSLPQFYYDAGIKVNGGQVKESMAFLEDVWKDMFPDNVFEYRFLDEQIAKSYEEEQRTFTLFKVFSGMTLFIACLGLYGLVSFMASQKLKEVGIRKVLGASVNQIILLFSKEFVALILIAFVVAAPLMWYAMSEWLSGFAYQSGISWHAFAIAVVATLMVALLTVGYKALKAATLNPVDTLRNE